MEDRNEPDAERAQDAHKALATADLAAVQPPDERWRASHETTESRNGGSNRSSEKSPVEEPVLRLFAADESSHLEKEWDQIQTGFVDAPRTAVRQADQLVASTMKRLAESFSAQRSALEHRWDRGGEVSTEDLRVALQRYRTFFRRLLAI